MRRLLIVDFSERTVFIGQEKLTDKENEIPAIPRLLDKLEINDAAQNLLLLRKMALQIVKTTDNKHSVQKRLVRVSLDSEYLFTLLKIFGV